MTVKHRAQISISRPSFGDGRELIEVRIKDMDAGVTFAEIHIPLADFASCLTGMSYVDCEMELRGTDNLGKLKVSESFDVSMGKEESYSDRKGRAKAAALSQCPEGWVISTYFGSQGSFYTKDGEEFGRTTITKWIDKPE